MFKLLEFIFLIYCTTVCYGVQKEIIFYAGVSCTGEGVILQTKQGDFVADAPRLSSSYKSTLGTGLWALYNGVNFTKGIQYWATDYEHPRCYNFSSPGIKSARYLGPPDTTTNSLSLYEDIVFRGRELTITGPAFSYLPFPPKSIWTTGPTSWTFYTGNNFDGTATCFIPRSNKLYDFSRILNSTLSNVGSILRGCERRIDLFIYGGDKNEGIFELPRKF